MRNFTVLWPAVMVTCVIAGSVSADTLILKNGDRITGKVTDFKEGAIHFEPEYSDVIRVGLDRIANLVTDGPMTIRYVTGGYATGRLVEAPSGSLRLQDERSGLSNPIDIAAVDRIFPGAEIPTGYAWTVRANVGGTQRSGNTDSRSLHIDSEVEGRSEKNRARFEAEVNREISSGTETQDDMTLFAQHDHFLARKNYLYANAKAEKDQPQNIALRTTMGAGAGYQVLETDTIRLSLEAGPAYVNEDRVTGEDHGYLAARWAANFEYNVWDKFAELFHKHEGIADIEDTGNTLIDSSTGIRFPLSNGFLLTAKADVDWDSQPAPGATSLDKTYLITVGYQW